MGRAMKDSGVEWIGEIPEDWEVVPHKYVMHKEKSICDHYNGEQILSLTLNGVIIRDLDAGGKMPTTFDGYQYIKSGDLLLCLFDIDVTPRCVGLVKNDGITSPAYSRFIVHPGFLNSYYDYLLRALDDKKVFVPLSKNLRNSLTETDFGAIKTIVPPLHEQEIITMFLDKKCAELDSIIDQTRTSIEEYKHLKQAVITQAVTKGVRGDRPMKESGSVWFGEIPSEWNMKRLKYIFHIKKDIAGKEGYTVLSITQQGIKPKDLSKNEGQLAENYSKYQLVAPGDFAMNHMDLLTGWVDISMYSGVTSPDYRVFVLNDSEHNCRRYFLYMMQMCYFNRIFYGLGQGVSGMGRWRLQADKFLNFVITIPPLDEQQEIADYLDEKCTEIDALIAKKEQFLTELESYKKSLIYEYVTGKKAVPKQQEVAMVTFLDRRLLLMCRIIERMHPKGRIALQKGLFCADCLLGLNNETEYVRYTYGPYDTRIEEYEKALVQKGWVDIRKGSPVSYTPGVNFEEYRKAYQAQFGGVDAEIQKICEFLKPMRSSQAGRVATLLAVWNDFLIDNVSPTDAQIINEARTNWTPNKANSAESTWQGTLDKIRNKGFAPKGYGLHTKFQL